MTKKEERSGKKNQPQIPPTPPPKKSPYPSPNTRFVKIEDMDDEKSE